LVESPKFGWTLFRFQPAQGAKDVEKPVFCKVLNDPISMRGGKNGMMVRIAYPRLPFADKELIGELRK
jgi:hypothetical protein